MRGRFDALVVVGALVVTVGGSSALAAGARPAKPPQGINASGEPTPPKPRTPRASQERRVRIFSGQDADAATQTADREFPEFVREKAWKDLSDSPGVRVRRY